MLKWTIYIQDDQSHIQAAIENATKYFGNLFSFRFVSFDLICFTKFRCKSVYDMVAEFKYKKKHNDLVYKWNDLFVPVFCLVFDESLVHTQRQLSRLKWVTTMYTDSFDEI